MAAPSLAQSVVATSVDELTAITGTFAGACTAGGFIVAQINSRGGATVSDAGGMTLHDSQVNNSTTGAVYTVRAAGGETAFTFTFTAACDATLFLTEWSGVDGTTATDGIDVSAKLNNGLTSSLSQSTGTTATTTVADAVAVAGCAMDDSRTTGITASNGFTVVGEATTEGGAGAPGSEIDAAVATKTLSATGTVETTFTWATQTARSRAHVVVLKGTTGGLTAVGRELGLVWDARATVGDPLQAVWDTRQAIGDPLDAQWAVRALAGDPLQAVWDTRATVGDALDLSWDVAGALTPVGRDLDSVWDTRALAGDTIDVQWDTRILAAKNVQSVWDVSTAVGDPLEVLWNVDSALTVVGDDLALSWDVNALATVGRDLGTVWDVRTTVAQTLDNRWDTRALVGDTLAADWSVKALAGDTAQLVWNVESDAALRDIHALADIAPATWAAATLHKSTAATVDPTRWDAT